MDEFGKTKKRANHWYLIIGLVLIIIWAVAQLSNEAMQTEFRFDEVGVDMNTANGVNWTFDCDQPGNYSIKISVQKSKSDTATIYSIERTGYVNGSTWLHFFDLPVYQYRTVEVTNIDTRISEMQRWF